MEEELKEIVTGIFKPPFYISMDEYDSPFIVDSDNNRVLCCGDMFLEEDDAVLFCDHIVELLNERWCTNGK